MGEWDLVTSLGWRGRERLTYNINKINCSVLYERWK